MLSHLIKLVCPSFSLVPRYLIDFDEVDDNDDDDNNNMLKTTHDNKPEESKQCSIVKATWARESALCSAQYKLHWQRCCDCKIN